MASFDLQGFRPDQFNGLTVQTVGNDTNIAGATYRLTMTEAGALGGGVSHFTAPDSRPNYTSANAQASIAFNNAQFGVVPIAEALKVSDPNHIVVSANLMPFNAGDTFIGTHTEVVVAGGLDQDVYTTFSPQPDAPGQTHGCVGGELQGSFYSWQTRCDVAQNFTLDSLYLGHGGTHTIPGAQFVTEGRFLGGADFSLENVGTAITIRPPKGDNPASGSFTQVRVLDFSVSTGVTNAITLIANLNQGLDSTLDYGFMHQQGADSISYPMYTATDGIFQLALANGSSTVSHTLTGAYTQHPFCTKGVEGTTSLPGLTMQWSTTGGNIWSVQVSSPTSNSSGSPILIDLNCGTAVPQS